MAYLAADRPVDVVLGEARENLQRYQYVEQQVAQRKQRLQVKEPEIRHCLDAVNLLLKQKESGEAKVSIQYFKMPCILVCICFHSSPGNPHHILFKVDHRKTIPLVCVLDGRRWSISLYRIKYMLGLVWKVWSPWVCG